MFIRAVAPFLLAVLLVAPALAQEHSPDASTLLLLHCNDSLSGAQGETPTTATGVTFEAGIYSTGAYLPAGSRLEYTASGNVSGPEGTVEFWFKPRWHGNDGAGHWIVAAGGPGGMRFGKDGGNFWRMILNLYGAGGQPELGAGFYVTGEWLANQWHHCAFTWSTTSLAVYVDGRLRSQTVPSFPPPALTATSLQIGADGAVDAAAGVIDELRISSVARAADEIRCSYERGLPAGAPTPPQVLIATAGNHRVGLEWTPYVDCRQRFAHYAIYRSTSPFGTVSGLTPIGTVADIATTQWADLTAANGAAYYYAVTTVLDGGEESTTVSSVGPRRPRDETDLQLLSISRTPRYPRYAPLYTQYTVSEPSGFGPYDFVVSTGLGSGQTPATPRWPNAGGLVTYTATVRNRGTNPWTAVLTGVWRVDGGTAGVPFMSAAGGGSAVAADARGGAGVAALDPGQTATFTHALAWDGLSHTIEFELSVTDARAENNRLAIDTRSPGYLTYVDAGAAENFHDVDSPAHPGNATDDIFDWLNRHMARLNQLFQDAGTHKRVHYEVLGMLKDFDADPAVPQVDFAIFPFRYHGSDGSLRTSSAYYNPADDIDYGLLHEMGHQLGLIDLYQMNLEPFMNQVSGLGYRTMPCLMNGVDEVISPHSALAMEHWLDDAHGYFGQYLYGIPAQVRMRFLGGSGLPLGGAQVKVYQKCERPGVGQVLSSQIKAQGTTDAVGVYVLPNVPIDPVVAPPALTGDTLRANPFGYVSTVGANGLLHFEVHYGSAVAYAWLDLAEVNLAYYSGSTQSATFERTLPTLVAVPEPAPRPIGWLRMRNPYVRGGEILLETGRASTLDVAIHDALGRRVASLASAAAASGTARLAWAGRTGSGERVQPGVYFLRARIGGYESARKFVLVEP